MNHFALDASALVKRYHNEPGAQVMQELMDELLADDPRRAMVSWPTLAETLASLIRKKNAGTISQSVYQAVQSNTNEVRSLVGSTFPGGMATRKHAKPSGLKLLTD